MPQKLVCYSEDEWKDIPIGLLEKMWKHSLKGYGVRFISRETGEEIGVESFIGLFHHIVLGVLEKPTSELS